MVKLYFLGGENVFKRDAKEINAAAFQDAGESPSVAVISWARPSFDAKYLRRKRVTEYFRSLGASNVSFLEFSDTFEEIVDKLSHSNLVYLTGGQVSALLSRLKERGVDNLLRGFCGVIVGRSAGAMVLGKNCVVINRYSRNRKVVEGLGFTDFSVKAHYDASNDDLLRRLSKTGKIYAIPQRAALVFDDGALSFFGDVFLFENGEKTVAK